MGMCEKGGEELERAQYCVYWKRGNGRERRGEELYVSARTGVQRMRW
jgi:hypothetical protein